MLEFIKKYFNIGNKYPPEIKIFNTDEGSFGKESLPPLFKWSYICEGTPETEMRALIGLARAVNQIITHLKNQESKELMR